MPASHDGEVRVARNSEGTPCAYHWSASANEWKLIGPVVDRPQGQQQPVDVNGKQYSTAFDVELDGKWMRLGYNDGENPYVAARRFIEDNDLMPDFLEEVAQFVMKNTGMTPSTMPAYTGPGDPLTGKGWPGLGKKPPNNKKQKAKSKKQNQQTTQKLINDFYHKVGIGTYRGLVPRREAVRGSTH